MTQILESLIKSLTRSEIKDMVRAQQCLRFSQEYRFGFLVHPTDFAPDLSAMDQEVMYVPVPEDGLYMVSSGVFSPHESGGDEDAAILIPNKGVLYVGALNGNRIRTDAGMIDTGQWTTTLPGSCVYVNDSVRPVKFELPSSVYRAHRK